MGCELEWKFACSADTLSAIAAAMGDFAPMDMETTYFDTQSGALSARFITLRRRLENGSSICTVKTPAQGNLRGEWEVPCGDIAQAVPMLCKLGAPEALLSLTAPGLAPVCGARFTRLAKTVVLEHCTIELALDSGILSGGGKELPFSEVEVEWKAGNQDDAVLYARQLAALYGLKMENRSKFRRALALAKGE